MKKVIALVFLMASCSSYAMNRTFNLVFTYGMWKTQKVIISISVEALFLSGHLVYLADKIKGDDQIKDKTTIPVTISIRGITKEDLNRFVDFAEGRFIDFKSLKSSKLIRLLKLLDFLVAKRVKRGVKITNDYSGPFVPKRDLLKELIEKIASTITHKDYTKFAQGKGILWDLIEYAPEDLLNQSRELLKKVSPVVSVFESSPPFMFEYDVDNELNLSVFAVNLLSFKQRLALFVLVEKMSKYNKKLQKILNTIPKAFLGVLIGEDLVEKFGGENWSTAWIVLKYLDDIESQAIQKRNIFPYLYYEKRFIKATNMVIQNLKTDKHLKRVQKRFKEVLKTIVRISEGKLKRLLSKKKNRGIVYVLIKDMEILYKTVELMPDKNFLERIKKHFKDVVGVSHKDYFKKKKFDGGESDEEEESGEEDEDN